MFSYEGNIIRIDDNEHTFQFDIRSVLVCKAYYVVLLSIPFNENYINNLFCIDNNAHIIWQSEDILKKYPDINNPLPYEQVLLKDGILYASDFYGRYFTISVETGDIISRGIGK